MVKIASKIAFLCVLASGTLYPDQIAISTFKGLDNNQNSVIIGPDMAQDLLNVDVTAGGHSIKKRPGYGLYKTLGGTQGLHGGFHAFDSSGNDYQLWATSTSIYGIVADGTATQIVSSATLNSTLDCADTQGSSYCVDSNRDFYIKTNGTTLQSWATSPIGTMVEATPDRIVVGGVSGNLNTIYHSGANSFNNFTTGLLATDPFTEVIAAPGSKLTHLRWACGKLLWWKDQSFGYEAFDDQYSLQIKIISDTIGTFDNTSTVDPGGSVWFRGQDGHIWRYDCSSLTKESIEITPFIQASGKRTSNSWTQTSQSDFQTGASSATGTLSTTISPGDVVTSSFNITENSNTQWSFGSVSNVVVGASSITLQTNNSGTVSDNNFDGSAPPNFSARWTTHESGVTIANYATYATDDCGTIYPSIGTMAIMLRNAASGPPALKVRIKSVDLGTTYAEEPFTWTSSQCTFIQRIVSAPSSYIGKRFRLQFYESNTGDYLVTTESYILGGDLTFYLASDQTNSSTYKAYFIATVGSGSSTITSGQFTSQSYNSGMPYSYNYSSATWTSDSRQAVVLQRSANNSVFYDVTGSTGQNNQTNSRYYRYISSLTVTGADSAIPVLRGVQIIAASSGTYFSAWKNSPNWAVWSTFNPTYSNGDGSHNFFIRSSTSPFTVLNSSPNWVSQPANSLITTSTGIYTQVIDSFTITSATGTSPSLNAFSLNWFEGSATDQAYFLFFDNSIWADVAYGAGISSNTYVFKRDLINDGWNIYNFGAGGMLIQNSHLFFGDVAATGQIFQYDSGNSDNGTAINAYWKSKDFTGGDPFLQSQLNQIDVFSKQNSGQSLTASYALDTSTTTTSYTINLSSTSQSIVQSRKQLPAGKNGYTFNFKLGDNTITSNWEVFGYRIGLTPQTYRPSQ